MTIIVIQHYLGSESELYTNLQFKIDKHLLNPFQIKENDRKFLFGEIGAVIT